MHAALAKQGNRKYHISPALYNPTTIFSKRQRITLRLLIAVAIPSVVCRLSSVCLSVTLVRPTQLVEIFGNFSSAFGTLAIR